MTCILTYDCVLVLVTIEVYFHVMSMISVYKLDQIACSLFVLNVPYFGKLCPSSLVSPSSRKPIDNRKGDRACGRH
jgi:hypothetical protein